MALTILERPIGVILGTCVDATINQDYNGFATVNKTAHGLSDNDWVYIRSNVENYNGFWQIDVINSDEFSLRQTNGVYVSWVVDCSLTYCPQESTHGISCVHLPITYKISNNRYPVNSIDTVRTITALANNSNFAQLTLSGSLGTFEDLSFVKISNAPDSDLNGVYQVVDKLSTSSVILNIAYASVTNATIIGASIQLYYGNYNVVIEVYAGINSTHEWAQEKPYELAVTLELIPDENNEVFFSINEYLKAYVKTENNLLLASLPNNIDAWTNFYIKTAEAYDTSNGYSVTTLETGFTSDQSTFEGTAVNAELEFKNIHSGYLSEYIMTNMTAKFLTLFTIPVLFACGEDTPDCYQDISFLIPHKDAGFKLKHEYYSNGVLSSTVYGNKYNSGNGVIRGELLNDCSYDRVDIGVIIYPSGTTLGNTDSGTSWVPGSTVMVTLPSPGSSTKIGYITFPLPAGTYDITATWVYPSFASSVMYVNYYLLDSAFNILADSGQQNIISNPQTITATLTSAQTVAYIAFRSTWDSGGGTGVVSLSEINTEIGETKTFDIDCGCSDQEIRLSWMNNLGAMEPAWAFTSQTGHSVDVTGSGETKKNIFPNWPKSYGSFADTIRKQTFRTSNKKEFISMEYIGKDRDDMEDKANALAYIRSSPLVQIVNSRQDRRTVLVDTDSFLKYTDGDKKITISFSISYTNDIPSQRA